MDLTLTRIHSGASGIFGIMTDMRGDSIAETLEHAYDQGEGKFAPKIPAGTYKCVRRLSPRFHFDVFMLENVPGCNFIEIHPGNYDKDSEGCILVGEITSEIDRYEMITKSRDTFEKLMKIQDGINEFVLTVVSGA